MSAHNEQDVDFEKYEIEFAAYRQEWDSIENLHGDLMDEAKVGGALVVLSGVVLALAEVKSGQEASRYNDLLSNPQNQAAFLRTSGLFIFACASAPFANVVRYYRNIRTFKKNYDWSD